MSYLHPEPHPYDLHFHLLGFPVRVHPGFWVVHFAIAAAFASIGFDSGILDATGAFLIMFICTTGAVLLHELGHVLAARKFGAYGEIELLAWGGLAGTGIEAHGTGHIIAVILSGPAVNILLAAIGWFGSQYLLTQEVMRQFYGLNENNTIHLSDHPLLYLALLKAFMTLFIVNLVLAIGSLIPLPCLYMFLSKDVFLNDGAMVIKVLIDSYCKKERPPWERDADWWKRT